MAELAAPAPMGPARDRASSRHPEDRPVTAAGLDLLRVLGWLVLHDVAVPGQPERSIDHVLAGPPGVYVINNVAWTGQIAIRDGVLTCAGTSRMDAVAEVAAAASAIRELLGGPPVAPMLSFVRLEAVFGVVADVALCATENILEILTGQDHRLDHGLLGTVSSTLARELRPVRLPSRGGAAGSARTAHRPSLLSRLRARDGSAQTGSTAPTSPPAPVPAPSVRPAPPVSPVADPTAAVRATVTAPAPAPGEAPVIDEAEAAAPTVPDVPATPPVVEPVVEPVVDEVPVVVVETVVEEPPVAEELVVEELVVEEPFAIEEPVAAPVAEVVVEEPVARVEPVLEAPAPAAPAHTPRHAAPAPTEAAEAAVAAVSRPPARRRLDVPQTERRFVRPAIAPAVTPTVVLPPAARPARPAVSRSVAEVVVETEPETETETETVPVVEQVVETETETETVPVVEQVVEPEPEPVLDQVEPDPVPVDVVKPEAEPYDEPEPELVAIDVPVDVVTPGAAPFDEQFDEPEAEAEQFDEPEAEVEQFDEPEVEPFEVPAHPSAPATAEDRARSRASVLRDRVALKRVRPIIVKAARKAALDEEAAPHRTALSRVLGPAVIGALIVAAVIAGGPRLPTLVSWGEHLFSATPGTTVGVLVPVGATALHPAGQVLAGLPVPARVTSGPHAPKGQQLFAVPVRVANAGDQRWDLALTTSLTVVDSLGISHRPAGAVRTIAAGAVLPGTVRIPPRGEVRGYLLFSVPVGRTLGSVQLGLEAPPAAPITWHVGS